MSDRPFRIPESTLYAAEADEFDEFGSNDLPSYSDWRGTFYKVPWAVDEDGGYYVGQQIRGKLRIWDLFAFLAHAAVAGGSVHGRYYGVDVGREPDGLPGLRRDPDRERVPAPVDRLHG